MLPIAFSKPYFDDAEPRAAADAVASGWVVGGPQLRALEAEIAERCNVAEAVGVSSWTAGGYLALHALGIGPGDEVIVPSLTFIASVNIIRHCGATPVFCDIDPDTWNIDVTQIEALVTPRTKAIIPVDQVGLPCDIDPIINIATRHNLFVLHDAACSFASRYKGQPIGSLSPITCFSLHARKIITCGEGGMITTSDRTLAARLRRLRHQGMSLSDFERHGLPPSQFETYPEVGYNFRITDIQAAVARAQIAKTESILDKRRAIAERYTAALATHPLLRPPTVPAYAQPNWQSYQVQLRKGTADLRNRVIDVLHAQGIPTRRGVMASHLEPPYAGYRAALPVTEHVAATTLQLPMHPGLEADQVDRIIDATMAVHKNI